MQTRQQALDAGMDGFYGKPLDIEKALQDITDNFGNNVDLL